jgi:3'-5' exoribonuclease-like protein
MRIWFDTEFIEDGRTIDLISIGAVREDGATYYAQSAEFLDRRFQNRVAGHTWLSNNVIPKLSFEAGAFTPRHIITVELTRFAGINPEFWAYYASYDWVVLCQLFGTMVELPQGWPKYCRDLKQIVGRIELPKQTTPEHHALNDAIWLRDAHLWFEDKYKLR